ncbi:ABC transporter permease [Actinoallomurus sp. CA-150999]|uniref:ABC transporter permease n=1 Tax=Actinoallomurus sp. CA-150999 TaxID=3239887 RepID=UPI003D91108E
MTATTRTITGQTEPFRRAAPPDSWNGSTPATQILVLTMRSLRALVIDPRMLLISMLGPLLMLVVFGQIFAGMAHAPGFPPHMRYIDFLVPAIMMTTALQSALNTATGLIQEMKSGIISRFLSLPIWPGSVLLARSLADLTRTSLQLSFLVLISFLAFGFTPPGGVVGTFAALGMALIVGGCLGWIFIALACHVRRVEVMQGIAGLVTFPLMFASNAFAPVSGLPPWLRAVASVNPMTYGIDTARNLTLGRPVGGSAISAISISLAIVVVSVLLAVSGFRRAGAPR